MNRQWTPEAVRAVDPDILIAHVDATDLFVADSPDFEADARHRQEIVFLALDLVSGKINKTLSLTHEPLAFTVGRNAIWFMDATVAMLGSSLADGWVRPA